jgi:hypothetical protein
MAPSDPPAAPQAAKGDQLEKGAVVAGARLIEPVTRGQKITCWRAMRPDGSPATIHALVKDASEREKENFLKGARKLAVVARNRPLPGIVDIAAVVPNLPAYLSRGGIAGTMVDVTILGWGVKETITFVRRLGRALSALHSHGLVHGCLYPGNVLLDDDLNPRLSDASMLLLDDSFDGPSDMQHDYARYAAREVRLGRKPDVRSDIFSLGRLLYFVLHGEQPDEADEDTPVLGALEHAPAGLVRIIRRCTLRDPGGRYGSIEELLAQLEQWRDADAVGVTHPHGREGGAPGGTPDSGQPRASDEPPSSGQGGAPPSWRPSDSERPQAIEKNRQRVAAAAQKKQQPQPQQQQQGEAPVAQVRTYTAPPPADDDDVISPLQARIGGSLALVLFLGSLVMAYFGGVASNIAVAGAIIGAIGLSLFFPPIGAPVVSRFATALLLGLTAWYIDPVAAFAERGRHARLRDGTPEERAMRLVKMKARGFHDFGRLDLVGVDFSNQDLAGLSFSGSNLRAAIFKGATLRGAVVDGTNLRAADFSGADLTGVDVAQSEGWLESVCSDTTTMPDGWACREARPIPIIALTP